MQAETQLGQGLVDALATHCFSAYQLHSEWNVKGKWTSLSHAGGAETGWDGAAAIRETTRFDLASLTKVISTASVVARLVDKKGLRVSDTVGKYLPSVKGSVAQLTLRELLTHTAGLKAWQAVHDGAAEQGHRPFLDWFEKNRAMLTVGPPGTAVVYSDIGFLLLGEVLQRATGQELADLFRAEVAEPLSLDVAYGPVKGNVAATEFCLKRNRLLHGEVHDLNSYVLGGKTPHAGLFSSAEALAPFAREWLAAVRGESKWLTRETAEAFTKREVMLAGVPRALGWDMPSEKGSSAGEVMSRTSFGHLGYTGTSLWIDPDKQGFVVFLTNRVHPSALDERIRTLRPFVHDKMAQVWKENAS